MDDTKTVAVIADLLDSATKDAEKINPQRMLKTFDMRLAHNLLKVARQLGTDDERKAAMEWILESFKALKNEVKRLRAQRRVLRKNIGQLNVAHELLLKRKQVAGNETALAAILDHMKALSSGVEEIDRRTSCLQVFGGALPIQLTQPNGLPIAPTCNANGNGHKPAVSLQHGHTDDVSTSGQQQVRY